MATDTDTRSGIGRRAFLTRIAVVAGGSVLAAACAPAAPAAPTAAPAKPTEAPKAAATSAPAAAAPTSAPAAAKPTEAPKPTAAPAAKPTEAPKAEAKPAAGTIELTWTFWDNPKNVGYEDIVANWSKANPNIVIKMMPTPDRYEDKVRTMLSAGTPPEIIQVNDDYNYAYAVKGWTRPLDDYIKAAGWKKEDYYPVIWEFGWATGKFTYVTIGTRPRAIIYNVDMLQKAGLKLLPNVWDPTKWDQPKWWNWDKAVEYGKALTKVEGNRTAVWGTCLWTEGRSESYWAMATGLEGAPYSKDGKKFTLATPQGIQTTQWLADLTCKYKIAPDQASLRQMGYVDLFQSGQLAMFMGNSAHTSAFRTTIKNFKYDIGPWPVGPAGINPAGISLVGMCIPVKTKYPDQAWKFLEFVCNDDSQKILAQKAFIPSRLDQAKYFDVPGQPPAANMMYVESMKYGVMENFTENTERARQIYATEMEAIMNCSKTAEEVLNKVKPDVEAALEGKL